MLWFICGLGRAPSLLLPFVTPPAGRPQAVGEKAEEMKDKEETLCMETEKCAVVAGTMSQGSDEKQEVLQEAHVL